MDVCLFTQHRFGRPVDLFGAEESNILNNSFICVTIHE
jgi:hypothetical protein